MHAEPDDIETIELDDFEFSRPPLLGEGVLSYRPYNGREASQRCHYPVGLVSGRFTLYEVPASSLAAVASKSKAIQVSGEFHLCSGVAGELITLDWLPDISAGFDVVSGNGVPLFPGADYSVTEYGLVVMPGSKIDSSGVRVTYSKRCTSWELLHSGAV